MFVTRGRKALGNTLAEFHHFKDDGRVPNSHLPVLTYHHAVDVTAFDTKQILQTLVSNNGWDVDWIADNAIFPYTHYHSWAHEVLIIMRGRVKLRLGGRHGLDMEFSTGDAIAIPAGVAHQRISPDTFTVAGLYLKKQRWDVCRQDPDAYKRAKKKIPFAKLPTADPIFGSKGPLVKYWTDLKI